MQKTYKFRGSSSEVTPIQNWFNTGKLSIPGVMTMDYRAFELPDGRTVNPGDTITRDENGEFTING